MLIGGSIEACPRFPSLGVVDVWDAVTRQQVFSLDGHSGQVHRLAHDPDGRRLAVLGGLTPDGGGNLHPTHVKVWDIANGKALFSQPIMPGMRDQYVFFSPDGNLLALSRLGASAFVALQGRDLDCWRPQETVQATNSGSYFDMYINIPHERRAGNSAEEGIRQSSRERNDMAIMQPRITVVEVTG